MNENINENSVGGSPSIAPDSLEMVNYNVAGSDVVSGDGVCSVSGSDTVIESVDTGLVQSLLYEAGYSVSSGDVLAYSEAERQVDSEIIGRLDTINGTLTLILFFLLFQWVDKKIQVIIRGMTNE